MYQTHKKGKNEYRLYEKNGVSQKKMKQYI